MYQKIENFSINTVRGEDIENDLETVTKFYGDDDDLSPQLTSLKSQFNNENKLNFHDILSYMRGISSEERAIAQKWLNWYK